MGTENRKGDRTVKILKATYGERDCKDKLQELVSNNSLFLLVNNDLVGDPQVGQTKYLSLEWEYEGHTHNKQVREGEWLIIKNNTHKKLGIFYSNNDKRETQETIKKSLDTIRVASKDTADILTCMWQRQSDNPFTEFITWSKSYGHVGQVLSILQLLYNAQKIGDYEYVSFLEHDVLYPKGYFDYEPFKSGEVLTNMNYMGLCKDGWQPRKQNDEPFHQMTMRFDDAIKHMEDTFRNAMVVGAGLVEPQRMERIQWECKNPAVHVNHGHHYTSHFSIYSNEVVIVNEYWGDSTSYNHLFHG